jgi:hypothetical protein
MLFHSKRKVHGVVGPSTAASSIAAMQQKRFTIEFWYVDRMSQLHSSAVEVLMRGLCAVKDVIDISSTRGTTKLNTTNTSLA